MAHRFDLNVVQYRLNRDIREIASAQFQLHACIALHDIAGGTTEVRSAVKWVQSWLLERWGERDNSQGRLGARFASLARAHGQGDLVEAPDWVHERHDRALRARQWVGKDVTPLRDARDTLRVCALYATKQVTSPPHPAWLAIPTDTQPLAGKAETLHDLVNRLNTELS